MSRVPTLRPRFIARLHNERVRGEFQLAELQFPEGMPKSDAQWVYLAKRKADVEDDVFKRFAKALRVECGKAKA